jgi:hypothetical protein
MGDYGGGPDGSSAFGVPRGQQPVWMAFDQARASGGCVSTPLLPATSFNLQTKLDDPGSRAAVPLKCS